MAKKRKNLMIFKAADEEVKTGDVLR